MQNYSGGSPCKLIIYEIGTPEKTLYPGTQGYNLLISLNLNAPIKP